jgi:hypothetical protein
MALTIIDLINKNKAAYKHQYYIESVSLSYTLITKVLKQIIIEEKLSTGVAKMKLSDCIKLLKPKYRVSPLFTKRLKKSVFKRIVEFNDEHKAIMKELKYQYPDIRLKNASKTGLNTIVLLNTTLIRIKSNKK